jgi:hypothetical protein
MVFSGPPRFGDRNDGKGYIETGRSLFVVGEIFAINYDVEVKGPNQIEMQWTKRWLEMEPDATIESQREFIRQFKKGVGTKASNATTPHIALLPGDSRWNTVLAADAENNPRIVTADDIASLTLGTRVLFVALEITYLDNKKTHHLRTCQYLQPPPSNKIWHFCEAGVFPESD